MTPYVTLDGFRYYSNNSIYWFTLEERLIRATIAPYGILGTSVPTVRISSLGFSWEGDNKHIKFLYHYEWLEDTGAYRSFPNRRYYDHVPLFPDMWPTLVDGEAVAPAVEAAKFLLPRCRPAWEAEVLKNLR